ncbi:type II toxin-antitoxin system YafQ family toxin [Caballeronia sp. SEWSISQ10-4 2]|uniref:type II toxin-antitoxin system YafQ family toxin n=1 Tax=Caballeronia sp. SEWSISQ10-4 2 TaxID=2937438 RepID=UPI002656ABFB|nr:type II toxin-antitoxin system YafQ family toxin [Caballeronia sp. SEWSISQ10-4 2]MDN7182233.1 type II toxin-antitoxin system YafQ family toxin [Caballeronia sp. SEWSISQ10-4 2]
MSLKKSASSKRTTLPLSSDKTKQLGKDWERPSNSGRYDMTRLKDVMLLLVGNEGPLPAEYKDHPLTGEWADHRECHVGGDFLLIYRISKTEVVFVRSGTHAELFK